MAPQNILYPNGWLFGVAGHIKSGGIWIPWDGSVTVSGGSGDGAILDGVTASIRATVYNGTSKALAVDLTDAAGIHIATLPVTVSGGSVTVTATDLDIRNLLFATDKVDASGTALGASSAAIGKLSANDGVDIGNVDVASVTGNVTVVQGTGTNLHTVIDSGTTVVTQGTATNLKTQAENYQGGAAVAAGNPLQVTLANGTVPSHAVTNAGVFAVQVDGAALTSLQLIDDPVATLGTTTYTETSTKGNILGVVRRDADTTLVDTTNEIAPLQVNSAGQLKVAQILALPSGTNLIGYVGHGKTLKTKTGSASATFTVVAAVTSKKIKVYSLSLITASTTAVTVTFKDGAAGTAIGTYILQAITGTNFGITENLAVPSQLFETSAGVLLEMAFSAAQTVTYNLRYWDDDAT